MTLEAIRYSDGHLEVLDQLLLPFASEYVTVKNVKEGWGVIREMKVRGAPAIGITAGLSLAVEMKNTHFGSKKELQEFVKDKMSYLVTARPTAVNIQDSERKLNKMTETAMKTGTISLEEMKSKLLSWLESMLPEDIAVNKAMGKHGAEHILNTSNGRPVTLLTHCNAGALATGGYGTAVGVVRSVHSDGKLHHCYCTETRPYNQGARLTAYELVYEKIPSTLICDSMVSMLMKDKGISAVVVGADRVVANGDTANKIGTYQLAIAAKYHGVPFYVIAPSSSIDLTLETGKDIVIEERPHQELTDINGKRIAAPGIGVWNPAFDVTTASLITGGIVTEFGVYSPKELKEQLTKELNRIRINDL